MPLIRATKATAAENSVVTGERNRERAMRGDHAVNGRRHNGAIAAADIPSVPAVSCLSFIFFLPRFFSSNFTSKSWTLPRHKSFSGSN